MSDNTILIQKLQGLKEEIAALDIAIDSLMSQRADLEQTLENGVAILLSGEDADTEVTRVHSR